MSRLEYIEAIEKRLWNASKTLRANSNNASNEYLLPVMDLVFLRHAYSRFIGVRNSIEDNLPTRDGKTCQLSKVGYEINFNREFFQYRPPRPLAEIDAELAEVEKRILALLREVTE